MNGVSTRDRLEIRIAEWEIAFENAFGFIGIVRDYNESTGWMTMCPVFSYISNPNVAPLPDGRVNLKPNIRVLIPIEFMASEVPERFKATRRRRLIDYDDEDRKVFEDAIREAMENCIKLRAARSHLAIVHEIPRGLPKPGWPGGLLG